MDTLTRELRWSVRRLVASPWSSLAALVVLAFGLASTVTIFTVDRAILFEAIPLRNSAELVVVHRTISGEPMTMHSPADLLDLRQHTELFAAVSGSAQFRSLMTGVPEPAYVRGQSVTPDYFETLGATPELGRFFSGVDAQLNVVVLSWQFWQQRFGADPSIVGKTILLNADPYRVVAVTSRRVGFLDADLWVPGPDGLPASPVPMGPAFRTRRDLAYLSILGRVRGDLTAAQVKSSMKMVSHAIAERYSSGVPNVQFAIQPLKDMVVGSSEKQLALISAAGVLLLLLSCLSVAGLLVGRVVGRSRENAIKIALGASSARAIAGSVADSVVLASAGGLLGIAAAIPGVRVFLALAPPMQRSEGAVVNASVLLVTLCLTIFASIVLCLFPSLRTIRSGTQLVLSSTAARGNTHRRNFTWTTLVVFQVALTLPLSVVSLSLSRRLLELRSVDLGFKPSGLVIASLVLPADRYSNLGANAGFFDDLLVRVGARRGVEGVAASADLPLYRGKLGLPFSIIGGAGEGTQPSPEGWLSPVSASYFKTMGMKIVSGRGFTENDRPGSSGVAIVNQAMAHRYWGRGNAVGAQLRFENGVATVVGVVSNARYTISDTVVEPRVYRPYAQVPMSAMYVVLRGNDPAHLMSLLRGIVREIDPAQPLPVFSLMEETFRDSFRATRYLFLIIGGFGLIAVGVSAVGLFGLLSFVAYQSEFEVAVRLALGAPRGLLVGRQLWRGLLIALVGVVVGTTFMLLAVPFLKDITPAKDTLESTALPAAAFASLIVAALSSIVPACHVLRVDPSQISRRA